MPTAASAAAAASPPPSESEESPPPDESSDGAAGAEAAGAEAAAADATGAAAGGAGGDGWSDDDGDEASGAAAVPDEAAAPAAPQRKGRAVIAGESVDPTAPGVGVFGGAPTPGSGAVPELVVVPKSEASKALILSVLQGSFLFSQLAAGELDRVAGAMTSKAVSAGEVVIQQGDKGDYFYVVESGTFAITVDGAYVKTCGGGDSFGELSLLYSCPRAATVTADTAGHLWALDRAVFRFMVASTRESQLVDIVRGLRCVASRLRRRLRRRRRRRRRAHGAAARSALHPRPYPSPALSPAPLRSNVELLKALTDDQLSRVAEAVKVVGFKRGERIISKGELGAELFFVRTGAVRCFGATAAGAALEDVVIDAGGHFGERALLLGAPRAANVEAHAEGTTCYVLGRRAFAELLGPLKDLMERSLSMRVLASLPALARLAPAARERVVRSMRALELRDGDVRARAGAPYDSFYLVTRGTLRVARPAGDTELIGQGAYLGARALFGDEVADADVCAQGAAAVCALSRLELDAVLQGAAAAAYGGLRGGADAAAAAAAAATPGGTPSASARRMVAVAADPAAALAATPPRHTVPLAELETLRTLGAGTFGRVKLVRHRPSGRAFALKVLQKAQIVAFSQQKNVLNERNVLLAVDHPFVLKLESTAQDDDCLYMLLEYVQGGELFSYLANSKLGYIPVADARFYAACVLAGVGALHAQNILYRDLKPGEEGGGTGRALLPAPRSLAARRDAPRRLSFHARSSLLSPRPAPPPSPRQRT